MENYNIPAYWICHSVYFSCRNQSERVYVTMLTQGDTSQNQTHPYRVRHYQKAMIVFRESISPARFSGPLKILQCLLKRCIQRSLESLSASTNLQTLSSFVMPGEKNSEGQLVSRLTFGVGHFTCCVFWSEKKKRHTKETINTHTLYSVHDIPFCLFILLMYFDSIQWHPYV